MMHLLAILVLFFTLQSQCGEFGADLPDGASGVSVYDVDAWENMDTDYDQICEVAEYEKPSALMVWFRSVGGAMYVGLCSAKEYVVAKWYAMQRVLGWRKMKSNIASLNKSGRTEKMSY